MSQPSDSGASIHTMPRTIIGIRLLVFNSTHLDFVWPQHRRCVRREETIFQSHPDFLELRADIDSNRRRFHPWPDRGAFSWELWRCHWS
jgi:hypothetical protein